jgi:intermembrane space import and assembly protein 40
VSIFVTKDDVDNPEAVTSLAQDELYGIVLPSGELNWDCPCLGGMAYGPCGQEFKDAFSCFHYR